MQKIVSARYQTSFFRRYLMLAFLVIMGYLCQVCVIPYCSIAGVAPNLLYVVIGIVTVAYGKLRAFWVAMVFGLLMEIMLPSVTFMSLAVYPLSALFCSLLLHLFSSSKRSTGRRQSSSSLLRSSFL